MTKYKALQLVFAPLLLVAGDLINERDNLDLGKRPHELLATLSDVGLIGTEDTGILVVECMA